MKNSEIRELTVREIEERVDTERAAYKRLELNHTISPLDNPTKLRNARRTIARLLTELTKRNNQENK
ncbi:MAG TPA: 50S ribosomal protein L29 [Williamwhitmania sp.]|jgi:large subunit ribosomal protein L29|nr:50S ribosomal protein L29 [Williamwhitmania sp.]